MRKVFKNRQNQARSGHGRGGHTGNAGGRAAESRALWLRLVSAFLLAVLAAMAMPSSAGAALAVEEKTVRVAFPIQAGLTELDAYGKPTGYTYEYLEEVSQYTGWDYEFVLAEDDETDDLAEMDAKLCRGEIDLMGAMRYREEDSARYDYSSYSYGSVETVLQTLSGSAQADEIVINSQVPQSFRIAVLNLTGSHMQELKNFCDMNLVTPEFVLCQTVADQVAALSDGRAQLMLNTSMNYLEGVRTVARFANKPFYFVTAKGANAELMAQLNAAMLSIDRTDPNFTAGLFEKYFSPKSQSLQLSKAELSYVAGAGTLMAGILTRNPPYQYLENGAFKGISADMLAYIAGKTGLKFEFVAAETQEELFRMAAEGRVQLVVSMNYDYDLAREKGLSMTRPYVSSQYLLALNQSVDEGNLQGKRLALSSTSTYDGFFLGSVVRFDSVDDCIEAVSGGRADYTYADAYTVQYYINQPEYRNIKIVPQTYTPREVCFGVAKTEARELLSVLNKAVTTISEVDSQGIINQNIIRKQELSLMAFVRENPLASLLILFTVSAAVIAALSLSLFHRARRNRRSALELKKHYRVFAMLNEYFIEYNCKTQRLLVSYPSREESGQPRIEHYDLSPAADAPDTAELRSALREIIFSPEDGVQDVYLPCPDGRRHWIRIALETVMDDSQPAFKLGRISVIDDDKRKEEKLMRRAQLDSLTHLYNAETSRSLIEQHLSGLRPGDKGAIILIDVDNFKSVNDTYGHLCGDVVLQKVAEMLTREFRREDVVGRPGGDEFAVYLRSVRGRDALRKRCEQLCVKARTLTVKDDRTLTLSIGAAICLPGDRYDEIYRRADKALYEVKSAGRDGCRVAPRESDQT